MNKEKIYQILLFLMEVNFIVFSSDLTFNYHKTVNPGYRILIEDPLFANIYLVGKRKYEELYNLIQGNGISSDEDLIIYQENDLKYIFYKKTKLIESFGFGYKIIIYPSGKILEVND